MSEHDAGAHNAEVQAAWERKAQEQEDDLAEIEDAFPDAIPVRSGWRAVVRGGNTHRILRRCEHVHRTDLDAHECAAGLHIVYLNDVLKPPPVQRAFTYTVVITTDTPEHAMEVMHQRLNHDADHGFAYRITWH